jgi:hypothetical protein
MREPTEESEAAIKLEKPPCAKENVVKETVAYLVEFLLICRLIGVLLTRRIIDLL